MADEKVLIKLKKLLALSGSPNAAEAQASLDKAYELMARHDISAEQVNAVQLGYLQADVLTHNHEELPIEVFCITTIMEQFFGVKIIQVDTHHNNEKKVILVGKPDKIESATFIFNFLLTAYPNLYKRYLKDKKSQPESVFFSFGNMFFSSSTSTTVGDIFHQRMSVEDESKDTKDRKQAYFRGLTTGILEQLERTRKKVSQETGLVVISKDPYLEKLLKDLPEIKTNEALGEKDVTSEREGYNAGRSLQFSKALSDDKNRELPSSPQNAKVGKD
jgi:hypothetical protein